MNRRTNNSDAKYFTLAIAWVVIALWSSQTNAGGPELPVDAKLELVGIVVDNREVDVTQILRSKNQFWLPFNDLLPLLGISTSLSDESLILISPIGEVEIALDEIVRQNGVSYLNSHIITEKLLVDFVFDTKSFALIINLPWDREKSEVAEPVKLVPDVGPSAFNLNQIRLDYFTQYQDGDTTQAYNLYLSGRTYGGIWEFEGLKQDQQDFDVSRYHWLKEWEQKQLLVGKNQVNLGPLNPSFDLTGLHLLSSNRNLDKVSGRDLSRSGFARRVTISNQNFSGFAQAGSRAELRVEGRIIRSVRVRLDGTYEFFDVNFKNQQFVEIAVYIYDRSSNALLEIQRYDRNSSELLISQGQYVLYTGAGVAGSPLQDGNLNDDAYFALYRYGLTNRITVEAGFQDSGIERSESLGLQTSLGSHWIVAAQSAIRADVTRTQFDLLGNGKNWDFRGLYQLREADAGNSLAEESRLDVQSRIELSDKFSLSVRGRKSKIGRETSIQFIRPGFDWRINRTLSVGSVANQDGDMRSYLTKRFLKKGRLQIQIEKPFTQAILDWQWNDKLLLFANITHAEGGSEDQLVGFRYRPGEDFRNGFDFSYRRSESGTKSFLIEWDQVLMPGIYSSLSVNHQPKPNGLEHSDTRIEWRVTLDLAYGNRKLTPSRGRGSSIVGGSLVGRIVAGDTGLNNIDRASILLNGNPTPILVNNGYYSLANLKSGVYRVQLDAEHLPIEFVPDPKVVNVEIAKGAVTNLDLIARLEFSVAGRVYNPNGIAHSGAIVEIFNAQGESISKTRSDKFGLFRLDGLTPGQYSIVVIIKGEGGEDMSRGERKIHISNDFLFGQDVMTFDLLSDDPPTVRELLGQFLQNDYVFLARISD